MPTLRSSKKKKKPKKIPQKRPYNCDLCSYSTCIQNRMVLHIVRTHLGGKPFSCTLCSYKTSLRDDLLKHLRAHIGGDPYACTSCDFVTTQAAALENHAKTHTAEQPYGCDQCTFRASHQNTLLTHLESHADAESTCYLCNNPNVSLRAFKERRKGCRLCRLHTFACFTLTTLHMCVYCQKDCMLQWSYRRTTIHLRANSKLFYNYVNGVLTCSICTRTFKAKIGYFSHMQAHLKRKKCEGLLGHSILRNYRLNNCR